MPPRVAKPKAVRDLGSVDCAQLAAMAARVSEKAWSAEDMMKENAFAVFHHTQHIVFRFLRDFRDPGSCYENASWPIWRALLEPVMQQAAAAYGFTQPVFTKAMLARLLAGHRIDPHSDGAGSNERCHKVHVPLISNAQTRFFVDGEAFHLQVGRAYEVNNLASHGASNQGAEPRIHFIFEVFEGAYDAAETLEATARLS